MSMNDEALRQELKDFSANVQIEEEDIQIEEVMLESFFSKFKVKSRQDMLKKSFTFAAVLFLFLLLVVFGIYIFSTSKTIWKYGVVVELAPFYSRVHIYRWSDVDPVQVAPTIDVRLGGWYWDVRPGISSFNNSPQDTGAYLIPLFDFATEKLATINEETSEVPIFLFATPELELSNEEEIFNSIRAEVKRYNFDFKDEWAGVISGIQQSTFDWISIQQSIIIKLYYNSSSTYDEYPFSFPISQYNSLKKVNNQINNINNNDNNNDNINNTKNGLNERKKREEGVEGDEEESYETMGVIRIDSDLLNISFLPLDENLGSVVDQNLFVNLSLTSEEIFLELPYLHQNFSIYANQFLGYGYTSSISLHFPRLVSKSDYGVTEIEDPCAVAGSSFSSNINGVDYNFNGNFNVTNCIACILQIIDKSMGCNYSQCSFLGTYQPIVTGSKFIGTGRLSTFIKEISLPYNPKLIDIYNYSYDLCTTDWDELKLTYAQNKIDDLYFYCFNGLYSYELFQYGFGFDDNSQQIYFTEDEYNLQTSWALGVMTYETYTLGF